MAWVRSLTRVARGRSGSGRRSPPAPRRSRLIAAGFATVDRARARIEGSALGVRSRRLLPQGALTLAALTLAGYVMGLGRDKVLAHTFGAGAELDAYNAAFILPELALDVLVAGGLVAPFVPLFLGLRDEAAADAQRFGRTILGLATGVMLVASAVLFVLAPATVQLIVPGFPPEQQALYVGLFRAMCFTPPIFAAALVIGEVLVAERRFLWYGLAPIMYSGGIAAGALLLSGALGIYGAAVGAVGGAVLFLGTRLVGLRGTGFRPVPGFAFRTRGLGEFIRLLIPKMVSQPLEPMLFLYYTSLASGLVVGSVSSMNYARNFFDAPVALIGMSFAVAAFPALSDAANAGDRPAFARMFRKTLLSIVVLSTLAGAALFLSSRLVIGTFLGGGAFDAEDVSRTTLVLAVFAFAVPLESVVNLLARAVYATRNTILPTLGALAGFIAVVVVSQALLPTIGIAAIPASYAAGMAVRVLALVVAVAIRVRTIAPAGAEAPVPEGVVARLGLPSPASPRRSSRRWRQAALALVTVLIVAGTASAAGRALSGATIAAVPAVTPWAQEFPVASPDVPSLPPSPPAVIAATGPPAAWSAELNATPQPSPSPSPSPSPPPGPFAMDLYKKGDFVGEYVHTWCVPAAMQTSINIMSSGADTTKALQSKLYSLAYSLAPGDTGGPDAAGWPEGLTKLGYGKFALEMDKSMTVAVKAVAKAIRLTGRPGGLIVWYGWHSWVVSGFKATADPAYTDDFTVTGLYIEDVWYNRHSSIWGWSFPPDTFDKVSDLHIDYKPFHQWPEDPKREKQYLFVVPVQ
jgi:putative peptidoglycan lipid II flippase